MPILQYAVVLFLLSSGCKKTDSAVHSTVQPATDDLAADYNAIVSGAPTAQATAEVPLTACCTLKEVEEQLHDFSFFIRVHHSFIVNLNEVMKYVRGKDGYVVMIDGSSVNVSRSRKDALLKYF